MYAGRIIEQAPVANLFDRPLHPYTRGLLNCVPSLTEDRATLQDIPGTLPEPGHRPPGCRFSPRCAHAIAACAETIPALEEFEPGHAVACIRAAELAAA
jgi:peptide/nickel transport system ATP-binding protein/oligopeptide transport system ATP-binding protein